MGGDFVVAKYSAPRPSPARCPPDPLEIHGDGFIATATDDRIMPESAGKARNEAIRQRREAPMDAQWLNVAGVVLRD
jgi:hypothetical protein